MTPTSATVDHEAVIVGAGFSGIGVAISFDEAQLRDYLIVDEGGDFGGTWRWNTYPGVAVDIPAFSYQFSFEQRADWSRVYAPGRELLAYAQDCARSYGLYGRARFGTRIAGAQFDQARHVWLLRTSAGERLTARHVVDATGVLTQPKMPEIAGIDDFTGVTMHTARWDHAQKLGGRRVAVIGTGASAVQVIPAIAADVAHLTVFQRTPIWCLPKPDAALPAAARKTLEAIAPLRAITRAASQAFVELTFPLPAHYHRPLPIAKAIERGARAYLRREVADPELRAKLTPRYPLGCKRPGFHNDYLATYNRDNVSLETAPIARITPHGVRTEEGVEHEVDVLILATGFKVFDRGNLPKYPVIGRDGADLERWWDEHRHQAYEGVSVPGFPNYFMVLGPYGYNGSSYFNLVEAQARHITRCLRHGRECGATLVEVTAEGNDRYLAQMMRRRKRQVFWQGGCAGANSYYFDRHGDVPLRPSTSPEVAWRSGRFPLNDYRFARLAPASRDAGVAPAPAATRRRIRRA